MHESSGQEAEGRVVRPQIGGDVDTGMVGDIVEHLLFRSIERGRQSGHAFVTGSLENQLLLLLFQGADQ